MYRCLRVGTRESPLAIKQAEEIIERLKSKIPSLRVEVVSFQTQGDKDKSTPLSEIEGMDFFTKEIEEALLREEIDLAVHSAKDLSITLKKGLVIAALTNCIDPYDVLVSKRHLTLDKLPYQARIGTSSGRRKKQLKKYRSDFQIVDIRGNIEERLKLLDEGLLNLDGIVIAAAGLIRLGLEYRIIQRIPFKIIRPHPLQGRLAIQVKEDNWQIIRLIKMVYR